MASKPTVNTDASKTCSHDGAAGHTSASNNGSRTAEASKLQRDIGSRHMIFIALGGSIGAGLFVASGGALSAGGPLNLTLNFALVGLGVTCTMGALGEMAASFPVAGSFYTYAHMFVSEALGFAMGWNFVLNWLIIFPFELTCIASQIRFWNADIHPAVIITPILVGLVLLSFMGSRWYGEVEQAFGIGKATAIVVFVIVAILIISGGVPSDPRHGTGTIYWQDGNYVKHGFSGFMFIFRTAGMSYGGTELLGMTAAECKNPRKLLPLATKISFFRILLLYIVPLALLGLCVSANDPELSITGHGAKVSPFTLAADLAGLQPLATFFNALIVVALISMANASIYASSRALQALCEHGMGPRRGAQVKWGVPVWSLGLSFLFGLLAFTELAPGGEAIFDWLLSVSGACNYYTWTTICVSHIRFRRAWKIQGRETSELLWCSPFGVAGSWVGLSICVVGLLSNVYTAIMPIDGKHEAGTIIRDNIGTLIPPLVYGGFCLWKRASGHTTVDALFRKPMDIDMTGIRLRADESAGSMQEQPTTPSSKA